MAKAKRAKKEKSVYSLKHEGRHPHQHTHRRVPVTGAGRGEQPPSRGLSTAQPRPWTRNSSGGARTSRTSPTL